jgi:4-hydroxy-tetrahydrodipicolinate reductase
MIHLILTGSAGQMGQAIMNVLPNFPKIVLVAAIEAKGHPLLGKPAFKDIPFTGGLAEKIGGADVMVDFTSAGPSVTNLKMAASAKKAAVIGATGHGPEQRGEMLSLSKVIPVVYSPNMSVGMNTMWMLIGEAAQTLGRNYQIDIVETHHIHKKDAPSGTAKRMLEILAERGGYSLDKDVFFHVEGQAGQCNKDSSGGALSPPVEGKEGKNGIRVRSIREGGVVGDHTIIFTNPYERLEITHRAFSREVFAMGALRAAEWVVGKPAGLYSMKEVLEL